MDYNNIYDDPKQTDPETEPLNEPVTTRYQPPVYNQPQQPQYQPPVYNQPQYQQPAYSQQQAQPQYAQPVGENTSPLLVFGILALAFACTFYVSFLGIVFGAMQKNKLEAYLAAGGIYAGKAKVGGILGKVGLIVGIVLTAIFAVYLTVLIFAVLLA